VADRALFAPGDWGEGLDRRFDLILCNPPYVEADAPLAADVADWEPAEALYAGPDGLDAYRSLSSQLTRLLAPGGLACVEIGAGQGRAVSALFAAAFTISSRKDLNGIPRCLLLSA
jgi:release factor glutamine methyltransferase